MNFVDRYNAAVGAAVAVLTALFGVYWYLFAGYLILNVLDWLTGWYKSRKLGKESSAVGWKGAAKKVGYWVIILVAFLMPTLFIHLGQDMLGINLDFLMLFGWFTLASLLVNEIRSILENLVECGYNVPEFLIKGLAVTEKLIQAGAGVGDKEGKRGGDPTSPGRAVSRRPQGQPRNNREEKRRKRTMIKANTGNHEMQAPHTAEECHQNDAPHNHPETDCGHYVPSGPGVDLVDSNAPGNDDTVQKEDAENGPGVQIGKDAVTGPGAGL